MSERKWGLGKRENEKPFDITWVGGGPILREDPLHPVHLHHGEFAHSTSDNTTYARDPKDGEVLGFSGHRRLFSVVVDSYNYLKESELSGDEIRRGCTCRLYVNGYAFYEIGGRDPEDLLLRAALKLRGFGEGPEGYYLDAVASGQPNSLVGRKVYWRDTPAVITHVIPEQGCVCLEVDGVERFPPDAYEIEAVLKGEPDDDWGEEKRSVKTHADDRNIHWWRETPDDDQGATAATSGAGRLAPNAMTAEDILEKEA